MAHEAVSLLPSPLPRDGGGRAESSRDFPEGKGIRAVPCQVWDPSASAEQLLLWLSGPCREGEPRDWPAGTTGSLPGRLGSETLGPEGGAGYPLGLVPGLGVGALRAGAVGRSHCGQWGERAYSDQAPPLV